MIRVIAAMGGEIERDREALLAGREVAAIEGVGIFRRREAGVLAHGPRLVDIHGRVGAAQIGRDAGPCIEEIDALQIGFAVARLDEETLGREPRLRVALAAGHGSLLECNVGEIRNAGHSVVSISARYQATRIYVL